MKRLIVSAFMVVGLALSSQGQSISKNALGLRLGSNDGFGAEVSYQRALKANKRLEFDLGWRDSKNVSAIKLVGLHQWVWNIDQGFNWYAGVGAGLGSWSYSAYGNKDSGTFLFAAGDIGIEYNFDFPLQLSLDYRPELYFHSDGYRDSNFGSDMALSARYKFN
ncbi:hypothetical protein OX284_006335 [Flavobacterium sp. SUN046]|uniref:hypothetical protein n=1 Tax=Flavobacterium sp. SUN046 TaxID=3002440 RepID=UPI002DB69818|nr:hypothetical protein [Flavobacterium sp. SUN046]MEC4049039.1 hypothetical protein [Flavobacterium sp. SUN046]